MTPIGCRVTRTSRTVMCVSTETQKNVTNHRGQSQNKQSGFERTCPTCEGNELTKHEGIPLLKFLQIADKEAGAVQNFIYCIELQFDSFE